MHLQPLLALTCSPGSSIHTPAHGPRSPVSAWPSFPASVMPLESQSLAESQLCLFGALLVWIPSGPSLTLGLHCHHGLAWQSLSCVWHCSSPPHLIMFCGLTPQFDLRSLSATNWSDDLESWLNLGTISEPTLLGLCRTGLWVAGPPPSWPWYWPQLLASRQSLLFLTLYFHCQLCASGKNLCL